MNRTGLYRLCALLLAAVVVAPGCTQDSPTSAAPDGATLAQSAHALPAPAGLVTVSVGDEDVTFWPYTGDGFDGTPVDPINLVFVGEADPVQIRSALLALDGDRTGSGFPDVYPFNATWSEAIGNVQTGYTEAGGWTGSVVQLQLGFYEPIRAHLRLFRGETADGRVVTLGGAHFEVLIPGTTEHQVLSWEIPQQLVVADLARSGLLGAAPVSTGLINQAPAYRDIPAQIYNGLPPELRAMIGGPMDDVTDPVPLVSDGEASLLVLAGSMPPPTEPLTQTLSVMFDQFIPMPFCSGGPLDWVHVSGPVAFQRTGTVDDTGMYSYQSTYQGHLVIVPVDITAQPPVPAGPPFKAVVHGNQSGFQAGEVFKVQAKDQRVAATGAGGAEFLRTLLRVSSSGNNVFQAATKCLDGS